MTHFQRQPYSKQQLIRLFDAIQLPRLAVASLLALTTGMRGFEVCSTRLDEIKWDLGQIHKPYTKGGKPRVYYLDKLVMDILRDYCCLLGKTDYLFPSRERKSPHMTRAGLYSGFRIALQRAGLWSRRDGERLHDHDFHALRTTFCSLLVNNDVPIFTAAKLMGHTKVSVTERHYAVLGDKAQVRALEAVFGKHRTPIARRMAKDASVVVDERLERGGGILPVGGDVVLPQRDPMHVLQLALAEGRISVEQYKERATALRSA